MVDARRSFFLESVIVTSRLNEVVQHLRDALLLRDGAGMTDEQLLDSFISQRDQAAFAAVVRRHGGMVWGVCRRILRSCHDAEDAFQATFLVLARRAAVITPRALLANWLYGVAHQTALKARTTAARRKLRERQVIEMPDLAAPEQDSWREIRPLLDQELNRLPSKYRAAIVLCDLEGKTRKEAARQLGIPEGTLSGRLTRGRTLLAKRLARHGPLISGGALATLLAQNAAAGAPAALLSSTVEAVSYFAAGQAAGVISAQVAALTKGVLKTMLFTKCKFAGAALLAIAAAGLVAGSLTGQPGISVQTSLVAKTATAAQPGAATRQEDLSKLLDRLGKLPAELVKSTKKDDEMVDALYRASLKRAPTDMEKTRVTQQLKAAPDRAEACRDILWALVNSTEFSKQHNLDRNIPETLLLLNRASENWEDEIVQDLMSSLAGADPKREAENLKTTVLNLEARLWAAGTRYDADTIQKMYAEDFVAFSKDGRSDRAANVQATKETRSANIKIGAAEVVRVNDHAAIVTYTASWRIHGKDGTLVQERRNHRISNCWARRDGRWVLVFSQELVLPGGQ